MNEAIDRRLECDFCGNVTEQTKRIALDVNYNRILAKALYACSECSDRKEQERIWNGK